MGEIEELLVFESIVAEKLTARDPFCHLPTSFDRLVGFVKGKLCCQQRKLQCVSPLSNCFPLFDPGLAINSFCCCGFVQRTQQYFFCLTPPPYTQFRDLGVRPAPRGAFGLRGKEEVFLEVEWPRFEPRTSSIRRGSTIHAATPTWTAPSCGTTENCCMGLTLQQLF